MKILKIIEQQFGWLFLGALAMALIFPQLGNFFKFLITPFLAGTLFISFLKVNLKDVFHYVKKPFLVLYLLIFYLLILPVLIFGVSHFISPELSLGFFLLTAIPPGVTTPVLTDIVKGNIGLSLVLTVLGHLIAPFSIVFLCYVFTPVSIQLDLLGIFKNLILFIGLPLIFSQIFQYFFPRWLQEIKPGITATSILLIALILYGVVATQTSFILDHPSRVFAELLGLYGLFIVLHGVGYFLPFWRPVPDKITSAVSKAYPNTALAILLAYQFFPPEVVLLTVLAEIPFGTLLSPFKKILRFFQKREGNSSLTRD